MEDTVVVVGAGLSGSLMALMLAQRGHKILVLEKRPHPNAKRAVNKNSDNNNDSMMLGRLTDTTKRSINLALSYRGTEALKAAGLYGYVEPSLLTMRGRFVHPIGGKVQFQAYGKNDQAIYSVSRQTLNELLLAKLEENQNVSLSFDTKVSRINSDGSVLLKRREKPDETIKPRLVIGADGAFSNVRNSLIKIARINYQQAFIHHGYRELTIPAVDGKFALTPEDGLHIWPRRDFMFIALPNPDKTFTCTYFAPFDGPTGLLTLPKTGVEKFFKENFPDVVDLIPHLEQQFVENPASPLLTVKCSPWNHEDKVVLIGDAAHATVPFYGQGMNAGFEDCLMFCEILDKNKGDLKSTVETFSKDRQPAGFALCDLSLQHFKDMSSNTISPLAQLKKRVEATLHWISPKWWVPEYTMVSFTRTPYHVALEKAKRQDHFLSAAAMTTLGVIVAAPAVYFGLKLRHKL